MGKTDCDILIIGAGLLGCAAARSLRRYDVSVTVLEKSSDVCTGISKGNSGIIYAGYDDRPGSLKAEMVVRACSRLPDLCRELDVHYRRTGSMMVGYGPRAEKVIRGKYEQGLANGVPGLELLSGEEAQEREPLLAPGVQIGLYAPGTATIDPWELCIALYENARANGAEFCMGSEVTSITRVPEGFKVGTAIRSAKADGENAAAGPSYTARAVINCAGLTTDKVREMVLEPRIRILPNASDYFVLGIPDGTGPSAVIFHEPERKGKGLTLIPTVHGEILAGSTQRKDPDTEGSPTSEEGLQHIMDLCREVVPEMPISPVIHSFAAIRPNPFEVYKQEPNDDQSAMQYGEQNDGDSPTAGEGRGPWHDGYEISDTRLHDFNILEEDGLFSLMGIKTPGLTCCVELGEYITDHVIEFLGKTSGIDYRSRSDSDVISGKTAERCDTIRCNEDYDPRRRDIRRFADIPADQLAAAVSSEPYLGRIICTCRKVSEHEIREAVRRGATTLDGVKRRTGVLMGKCQGSKCLDDVLEIMADELDIEPTEIVKDEPGSLIISQKSKKEDSTEAGVKAKAKV